jgi:hypothetical protein
MLFAIICYRPFAPLVHFLTSGIKVNSEMFLTLHAFIKDFGDSTKSIESHPRLF